MNNLLQEALRVLIWVNCGGNRVRPSLVGDALLANGAGNILLEVRGP